jgi:hypothetical protein
MSKLEDLVPPVELCKLIPAGEFEDSAFIWDKTTSIGFWDGEDKDGNHIGGFGKIPHKNYRLRQNYSERTRKHIKDQDIELDVFPAPTLQEILLEIEKAGGWCPTAFRLHDQWTVDYQLDKVDGMNEVEEQSAPDNPATAALELWLKLKGVENEK